MKRFISYKREIIVGIEKTRFMTKFVGSLLLKRFYDLLNFCES